MLDERLRAPVVGGRLGIRKGCCSIKPEVCLHLGDEETGRIEEVFKEVNRRLA